MNRIHLLCSLIVTFVSAAHLSAGETPTTTALGVTSPAPPIDIEHWISPGFSQVQTFESGKVYVVEFWATWCLPCIGSMPHLVELQEKYSDEGVRIISISDEPLETVEEFLKRKVLGSEKEQDYRELTAAYSLTTDPDRSVHKTYLEAANVGVIPTAFIVGKSSKIEWIGHPSELDEPLESVLAGTWNAEQFRLQWEETQRKKELDKQLRQLVADGELTKALKLVDNEFDEDPVARAAMRESLEQLNMLTVARAGDLEKTVSLAQQLLDRYEDDPEQLAKFTTQIRSVNRILPLPKSLMDDVIARLVALANEDSAEPKSQLYLSLAFLQMDLGQKDKAKETLTQFKELSDREKATAGPNDD